MILETVQEFLTKASRGEASLSPELVEEFGELCKTAIDRQFNREAREWRPYLSGVGKPVCQQKLEKESSGNPPSSEIDYTRIYKFLMGDLIEAYAIVVMKAAGLPVENEQTRVELEIAGVTVSGKMDCTLWQQVWDVKSASDFASMKFGEFGGYNKIKEDDPFGYVVQGHCYGKAIDMPFAGWIAINKSDGKWMVCEAPQYLAAQEEEAALKVAEENLQRVMTEKFVKEFDDFPEIHKEGKGKNAIETATGNRRMVKECGFCDHKRHCWPNCEVHREVASNRKNAPFVWYSKLKVKELKK